MEQIRGMKQIKLMATLILSFVFLGCPDLEKQEIRFASLEEPSFQESIQSLIESETKNKKVGRRKNKKGKDLNIEVGGKDLQFVDSNWKPLNTNTNNAVPAVLELSVDEDFQISDILFYAGDNTQNCLKHFSKEVKEQGFFTRLHDESSWQVSIPKRHYVSKPNQNINGNGNGKGQAWTERDLKLTRVLKSSQFTSKKGDRVLFKTISDNKKISGKDFMENLDDLLMDSKQDGFVRENSHLYVVVFDYEHFPYYTSKEWASFYKKHANLHIIFMSSRRVSVSNFSHILKSKKIKFDWLHTCDEKGITERLLNIIEN